MDAEHHQYYTYSYKFNKQTKIMNFIKNYTAELKTDIGKIMLLWGDPVYVNSGPDNSRDCKIKARTNIGTIKENELKETNDLIEI